MKKEYGVTLKHLDAIGFSAMMHGYLAFDENDTILVSFRTWRNTITEEAASKLTAEFNYNIPQRWSIAHLYQAILNGEEHVPYVDFFTTLAGYVHWRLTGRKVLGVGDASGMFPIDIYTGDYDQAMIQKFDKLVADQNYRWNLRDILPRVLAAGEEAGVLTEEGASLLDPSGDLQAGIPLCHPEGDAESKFTLANTMRMHLYSALAALKSGMDLMLKEEGVQVDQLFGHGGYFKTKGVGQRIAAAAMNAPVSVMETAGEGGAWGIAVLAAFLAKKKDGQSLGEFLNEEIFAGNKGVKMDPMAEDVEGFEKFMEKYMKNLPAEKAAVEAL